jgi:hypothetical protein
MLRKSRKRKRGKLVKNTPIIRVPIIFRKPTITRTPIIKYKKIKEYPFEFCKLDRVRTRDAVVEMEGCTKDKYMVLNPLTTRSKKDIISLLSSYNTLPYFYLNIDRILDINYIFWTLQQLSSRNLPVYITTSISLPDSILEELSKNPYNVVQFNIGEVSDDSSDYEDTELFLKHKNLKKCMYRSKTYGLYVVLRIEPVIPGITRVSRLISLIASVKNSCNHITVSFVRIWRSDDEGATYLKYRGEILDKKHFELNNDIWDCSEEYKDKGNSFVQ